MIPVAAGDYHCPMEHVPGRWSQIGATAAIAWLVVATAMWTLRAPTGGGAVEAAIACTLVVALLVWWVSGRYPLAATRWPTLIGLHAIVALLFASLLITVTYWVEAASRGTTLVASMRTGRFLGAEFVFWMWLYAVLAAGSYAVRIRSLLRDEREATARSEARLAEARLAVLRGQLNPHFLFNALHTVAGLVHRDPDAATAVIEQLGDLLRYSLDEAEDETVPLEEELRFTRTYLDLARAAIGDRLRVSMHVDERALSVPVPPFSLQVLAENAVRHGIALLPAGGEIAVRVAATGGGTEMTVENDGNCAAGAAPSPGMGLANLTARLDVIYGRAAQLEAAAREGGGFRARIFLPGR